MSRPKNPLLRAGRSTRQLGLHPVCERCRMCGRSALKDGVLLVLGRSPWAENRSDGSGSQWAICVDCSTGLRAYFRSLRISPNTLRRISSYESVHVRIGELLKAFGVSRPVPSSLISSVADLSSWRSRLRELRKAPFGWKVMPLRRKGPSGRVKCDYILLCEGSLPENPRHTITG